MGGGALSSKSDSRIYQSDDIVVAFASVESVGWAYLKCSRKTDTLTLASSACAPQIDVAKLDCHIADAPRKDWYRHPEIVSGSQTHPNLPLKGKEHKNLYLRPLR